MQFALLVYEYPKLLRHAMRTKMIPTSVRGGPTLIFYCLCRNNSVLPVKPVEVA